MTRLNYEIMREVDWKNSGEIKKMPNEVVTETFAAECLQGMHNERSSAQRKKKR